jgi:uncharacterized protein YndB with AHSA1/START domain
MRNLKAKPPKTMNTTLTSNPATSLTLTRLIPTSQDRVYALWTDVTRAKEWWGPEGCETQELVCDARPGGEFRWVLTAPDGEQMTARGEFREVQPGKKAVYTWQWTDDPRWAGHESLVTVEFIPKNPTTTELNLTHEDFPSQQSRDNHISGWNSALDKLERLLAK